MDKPRIGISACLLGRKVRWDGGHKREAFLEDVLGRHVEWVPVCPEVELGLGVPRESMRLEGSVENPRLFASGTGPDLTRRMRVWAGKRAGRLSGWGLCGFVLKSGSPSCGLRHVPVHGAAGTSRSGTGIFAHALMERLPLIPLAEEGDLRDPERRRDFLEAVFTLGRWREFMEGGKSRERLADFHARHKLLIMSHSVELCRAMGRLAAGENRLTRGGTYLSYEGLLRKSLALRTTVKKHVNVLQHAAGYFKRELDAQGKRTVGEAIEDFRKGVLDLSVPLALLRHYVRLYRQPYLEEQIYLYPDLPELRLSRHPSGAGNVPRTP